MYRIDFNEGKDRMEGGGLMDGRGDLLLRK
jgi:hypothetical protein